MIYETVLILSFSINKFFYEKCSPLKEESIDLKNLKNKLLLAVSLVLAVEFVNASGGVNQLHLASEERV